MKVKFNTDELKKYISKLGGVVAKKSTVPVFGFVRLFTAPIQATDLGPQKFAVSIIGVDVDSSLQLTFTKAESSDEIDVLLPFGKLVEIIGNISLPEISIEVSGETKAAVKAGKYRAELKTHPLSNWPSILERPEKALATIALPGLKEQIAQIDFAVPTDSSKFVVAVARVESTKEHFRLVATDGVRLAISTVPANFGEFTLNIPKPGLELIKKLDGAQLTIAEAEGGFYFDTELETLTVSRSHGEFPPYERILPTTSNTQISTKKKQLLEAIKRAKPLADPEAPVVVFAVESNGTTMSVNAAHNEAGTDGSTFRNMSADEVEAVTSGAANDFSMNVNYLLPFVEAAFGSADGEIIIKVLENTKTIDFVANDGKYRFLQMPVAPANRA